MMVLLKNYRLWQLMLFLLCIACNEEESNIAPLSNWSLEEANLDFPPQNFEFALDRKAKNDVIRFEWAKPVSERNYIITYNWLLDRIDGDFSDPLIRIMSGDKGVQPYAEVSYLQLDEALAKAGAGQNEKKILKWGVESVSTTKTSISSNPISLQRFDIPAPPQTLFIAGSATEVGDVLSDALPLYNLEKADGSKTNTFQIYTRLEAGNQYNFYDTKKGEVTKYTLEQERLTAGDIGIPVTETGVYRITVDFLTETLELVKIDKWSIVGNVISGAWGGDEALEYKGNGIWERSLELIDGDVGDANKRFIFRANGDWGQVYKRILGSESSLTLESTASALGYEGLEDISVDKLGQFKILLQLNGNGYRYTIQEDSASGTPKQLFLLEDGNNIAEFSKNGETFSYEFVAIDASKKYTINEKEDSSGRFYTLNGSLGETTEESDKVSGTGTLIEKEEALGITKNQAYRILIDFDTQTYSWDYYNFKLFHWNDWEGRDEKKMEYVGNYTWEVTSDFDVGYNSKFITPWDFEFGGVDSDTLMGDLLGTGGVDINNITEAGTYNVKMRLEKNFNSGEYVFTKM